MRTGAVAVASPAAGEAVGLDGALPLRVIGNVAAKCAVRGKRRSTWPPVSRADNVATLELEVNGPQMTMPHRTSRRFVGPRAPHRAARARHVCWGVAVVTIGGGAPVRVQSMTNTDTGRRDRHRDPGQGARARRLGAGAHHRQHARGGAAQVPHIREQLDRMGFDVPLIGDFHYNGHRLLTEYPGLRAGAVASTASIPATSARAPSATSSSRR